MTASPDSSFHDKQKPFDETRGVETVAESLAPAMTYGSYLKIEELLSLQQPVSRPVEHDVKGLRHFEKAIPFRHQFQAFVVFAVQFGGSSLNDVLKIRIHIQ